MSWDRDFFSQMQRHSMQSSLLFIVYQTHYHCDARRGDAQIQICNILIKIKLEIQGQTFFFSAEISSPVYVMRFIEHQMPKALLLKS